MAELQLSPLEAFERYAPLGPDFLTWLLVHVVESDLPEISVEPTLKLDIQGPMVFEGGQGEAGKMTLTGEEAATAPEVLSALREGKRLKRAKVLFNADEVAWHFTLDAVTFDLRGSKLPVPNMPDAADQLFIRLESLSQLYAILDELFEKFLQIRLDPETWRQELIFWRQWTQG